MNLCLQDIARDSKCIKGALNFAMEVIQSIKYSPKWQVVFEKVQKHHEDSPTSGLPTLCPTTWTVHTRAMQGILDNYLLLKEMMKSSSHGIDDCSWQASGMLAPM